MSDELPISGRASQSDAHLSKLLVSGSASEELQIAEANVWPEWKVGDVLLDLYEVREVLGRGGMGVVHRVRHRAWNMDVAVKSPRLDYFQTEAQKQNFLRECETWIHVGLHPHIVSCHYVRTLGGMPRIFAEYMDGGSLAEWIRSGRLYEGGRKEALARILDIAIQIAWGLDYAHNVGVVHQDVKPANVMLTLDDLAKVTDFGLARARVAAGETAGESEENILVSCGGMTREYCSPEQARGEQLGRQTDVYSWAVSVLHMITGKVSWSGGVAAQDALKHLADERAPRFDVPELPDSVRRILGQCLEVERANRPDNLAIVGDRLQEAYREVVHREYQRKRTKPSELLADALNNHAASLWDLGKFGDAERLFDEALQRSPGHPQAVFNRGVLRWHSGHETDLSLVATLNDAAKIRPADWVALHFLALVQLARVDPEGAISTLRRALALRGDSDCTRALALAEEMRSKSACCSRRFDGHKTGVTSLAMTADGSSVLSGSADGKLQLWDVCSGRAVRVFQGHKAGVTSLALSADSRRALSGSLDHTIRLWEIENGQCIQTFNGHHAGVTSVAISADGQWLLSGSQDETLRLWEVATGSCVKMQECRGHAGEVISVALSADGRWALSGSSYGRLRMWETRTLECLQAIPGHTRAITAVALSSDGEWALSSGADATVRLWRVAIGRCELVRECKGHLTEVTTLGISADARWGLSGSMDGSVRLWELTTGRCLRTFEDGCDGSTVVAFRPDGGQMVSGGRSAALKVRDLTALTRSPRAMHLAIAVAKPAGAIEAESRGARFNHLLRSAEEAFSTDRYAECERFLSDARLVDGYEFSPRALELCRQIGLRGSKVRLRGAWCTRQLVGQESKVTAVALSGDGRWSLAGSSCGKLRLCEVSTGRLVKAFGHPRLKARLLALSPDGRQAVSTDARGNLKFWDVNTGRCLHISRGGPQRIASIALSTDGHYVLSGSSHGKLRLWDVNTGRCVREFEKLKENVTSVALSGDQWWAVSGSEAGTLRLWSLNAGRPIKSFGKHRMRVTAVALSANGNWALSGSDDTTLRLWSLSTGGCVGEYKGHSSGVTSACLSMDDKWILSASTDRTIRLWDVATGRCVRTLEGHTASVTSLAVTADWRWAISGSEDKTIRLWELDWEYDFLEPANWDDRVKPYLEVFLTLHCQVGEVRLSTNGQRKSVWTAARAAWTEADFQKLVTELQYRGYGWLRPDAVHAKLKAMAANWSGPPAPP